MSSFSVKFNQFIDLAVNPALGTVNTSLLHNLLYIIINQLQLSSNIIEFHGDRSSAIENLIVNSHRQCEFEINEFLIKEEVDETTGNIVKRQEQVYRPLSEKTPKLFTIEKIETQPVCPIGYPLNPIHVHSVGQFEKIQTRSIHEVISNMTSSVEKFTTPENSLRTTFDFINTSKRLDALEIGIRQLADVLRNNQCELKEERDEAATLTEVEITSLHQKIDSLSSKMRAFHCKCNDEDFKDSLLSDFEKKITLDFMDLKETVRSEIENLKSFCELSSENIKHETTQFEVLVRERLESYKNDLIDCMTELQAMMNAKLDKSSVPDLKKYLQDMIRNLEEKIDNIECRKALAAGVAKRIFKDLNCVSCGDDVIQADARNPTKSLLTNNEENPIQTDVIQLQLLKLPTRLCGGNHTITTPSERVFRSEKCQN